MTVTAHQLSNAADVTYRVIDYWTRAGYITADPRPVGAGPGIPRTYPDDQMTRVRTISVLVRSGFTARGAYLAALALEQDGAAELGPFTLTPHHTSTGALTA